MSVDRAVSWAIVEKELEVVSALNDANAWGVQLFPDELRFRTHMKSSVDGEQYVLDVRCDDYKELPPFIEFVDPDSGALGTKHAYPKNGRSFFHAQPCICAPFSRKAYGQYNGPHSEWAMGNWMTLREGINTLGDMLVLIQTLINNPTAYNGRME